MPRTAKAERGTELGSGNLLGHYLGFTLFFLAIIWIPGTSDQFVGPRMVVVAALGVGILPLALLRWFRAPVPRLSRFAVGALLTMVAWACISALGSGAPLALSFLGWWGRDVRLLTILGAAGLLVAAATCDRAQAVLVLWWILTGAAVVSVVGVLQWTGVPVAVGLGGPVSLTMGHANLAAVYPGITAALAAGMAAVSPCRAPQAPGGAGP